MLEWAHRGALWTVSSCKVTKSPPRDQARRGAAGRQEAHGRWGERKQVKQVSGQHGPLSSPQHTSTSQSARRTEWIKRIVFTRRRHERTPVDEALDRGYQEIMDVINAYNAPNGSTPTEEVEDVEEGDEEMEEADLEGLKYDKYGTGGK